MRCDSDFHSVYLGLLAFIPQRVLAGHGGRANFRTRRREFYSDFLSQIKKKCFEAFPEDYGSHYRKLVFGYGLLLDTGRDSESPIFPNTKDRVAGSTVGHLLFCTPLGQSMDNQPISLNSPNPTLNRNVPPRCPLASSGVPVQLRPRTSAPVP